MKSGRNLINKMRSALAFALVFWCAGTGCVLVSYANSTAIGGTGSSPAQTEEPASSGANNSCHARHGSQKQEVPAQTRTNTTSEMTTGFEQIALPENRDPLGSMSCCPLAVGTFVVASRPHANDSNTAKLIPNEPFSLSLTNIHAAPRAYPLRLPNQDQTYLRCCVFLI